MMSTNAAATSRPTKKLISAMVPDELTAPGMVAERQVVVQVRQALAERGDADRDEPACAGPRPPQAPRPGSRAAASPIRWRLLPSGAPPGGTGGRSPGG